MRKNKSQVWPQLPFCVNHYHFNIISNASNSTILQGNCGSISVNCGGSQLSEQEAELLRIFRSLDMRRKNEVLSHLFGIEDQTKEVLPNG